ncbi:phosphoenolpyruvate--protein phosphotransferase [Paenibacillus thermoaerophilus]|uniref:Phosphoenolpyruvate-protein phosphotransferase n=1 Tax=Paenibacillus thermoaerophilus TaxID=1215385 RepID=A0ABW2V3D0_9BACL|nr:phosphoenolpyruvate--protein phosphotransferase [Paenibacillus thermoaerophilus]TMV19165.1 phosphoenolpyruvate--protein phosphotransferase [Paenibacillus thermoaerophilus]
MSALRLKGIPAAPGYAIGRAWVLDRETRGSVERRSVADVAAELERLDRAVSAAKADIRGLIDEVRRRLGAEEAEIFEAHLLLLEDEEFIGRARTRVAEQSRNAESALHETAEEIAGTLESMDDDYMKERAADIRDVGRRLIGHLTGADGNRSVRPAGPLVLIAGDLTPSETVRFQGTAAGFATAAGGRTAHAAILARALGLPAVVGIGERVLAVENGSVVVVDGTTGELLANPSPDELERYRELQARYEQRRRRLLPYRNLPSVTADGASVELAANIGSPLDAEAAADNGAEGVGLFRTEFLYMQHDALPGEDEQFEAYKSVALRFHGRPVVVRTLDVGGDKELKALPLPKEDNPFLGVRAIRLCLNRKDLFRTQLRALLRASVYGTIKIMFPMIATLAEWREARALLDAAAGELRREGVPVPDRLEAGIMVEVPSAAVLADLFAKEVDFFSIGTNDLVQYVMAADRMNPELARLNDPFHPAVLRLIRGVVEAARREGKRVGMCGEMAGNPLAVPLLLGLGLDEFSMSAGSILPVRALISRLNRSEMSRLAEEALKLDDPDAIRSLILRAVPGLADPD